MRHLKQFSACLISAAACLLCGCFAESTPGVRVDASHAVRDHFRPVFGQPLFVQGSKAVLFPFAAEAEKTEKEAFGGISSGSFVLMGSSASASGSYGDGSLRWNNVAFYNPENGQSKLLLDYPALICRFDAPGDHSPVRGPYLLFCIASTDTNSDGLINSDDAVVLIRTDLQGGDVRALSPEDAQVIGIDSAANASNWLYLRVRRDSDGDHHFTNRDRVEIFRVDAMIPSEPQRLMSDALAEDAMNIVLKAARSRTR